ncbi:MAG: hypothetical protein UR43_C0016G0005 [candidate division TM6 bacterium GW2011_GWF2_33_332]|nr:MAG: hypothetical protein UR43_C0016G0005 [candidate division TM6 bacterium GW2011_GWF2_33_332]
MNDLDIPVILTPIWNEGFTFYCLIINNKLGFVLSEIINTQTSP